jgi:lipopolysaccharide transport system permease protein
MFLTPIIYPLEVIPEPYRAMIRYNPFTPLVESYRRAMLEGQPPDWSGLLYFAACGLLLFLFGYWWFAKTRRNFADVI